MIVAIDIGNTQVKVGIFSGAGLLEVWRVAVSDLDESLKAKLLPGQIRKVGWASVARPDFQPANLSVWQSQEVVPEFVPITSNSSFPLENRYATPSTLGVDRILGVVAARTQCPKQPVLVIDAGTALTYDFATRDGAYLGGGISPGLRMRFAALHEFTARLPFVAVPEEIPALIGDSTQNSILSGVYNGIISEVEGIINRYRNTWGADLQVFLTGGDLYHFENQLECFNFADSNLILKGICHLVSDSHTA